MKVRILGTLLGIHLLFGAQAQNVKLEEVVQLAIQKNYDVLVLQKTADIATNDNRYAYGAFIPFVNASGNYLKNSNDVRTVTFADAENVRDGATSTNTTGSINLVWTLFDGTKMFATRKRIEELAVLGEANVRNQMMNTTASVINTYYNIVRQKQQLVATNELFAVSEERVKLAEKKLQVGTGGKPELLQAKVDLNSIRSAVLVQQTLIQQLKDQLNGLVGMSLPDRYEVTDSIPIDLSLTLEEIVTGIENTNQSLVVAKKNIDIANIQLRENRAGRSPVLGFVANYNYGQTENDIQTSPFALKYNRNKGYTYGLTVAVPIMNGMNVNRLISQSKINIDRQKLIYDQQLTLAVVGVRNAYVNYNNTKQQLLIEEENILLAKENVNIALESFKRGIATFIELRTAQQSLADAYNRLIAARFNTKLSETELHRLRGSLLR